MQPGQSPIPNQSAFSKGSSIERKRRIHSDHIAAPGATSSSSSTSSTTIAGFSGPHRLPPQTPLKSPAFRGHHQQHRTGFTPLVGVASSSPFMAPAQRTPSGSTTVTNGSSTQWHIVNPDPAGEPPFMAPLRQSSRANSLTLGDNTEAAVKNAATDYFETNFDVEGVIGAGSFGVVYKARSRADNQWYAVKRARKSYGGAMDRRRAHAEIAHFQRVLQPTDRTNAEHCVNLVAAWEQDGFLFLQTELCECGSLQRYLMSRQDALSEDLIWDLLSDMVLGLRHIHECDLVHLDVKPENFFFTSAGTLKIGDFGISKERNHTSAFENADLLQPSVSTSWDSATMAAALNRSNRSASDPVAPVKSKDALQPSGESEAGDAAYMAPELISRELGPVGQPADLFSLGAVLLELAADIDLPYREAGWMHLRHLHGQPPTAKAGALHGDLLTVNGPDGARTQCHTDGSSIMSEGARLQYEGRSTELRALIQRLLHRIPSARPTIDEVMAEPKLQTHLQRRQQMNSQSFLRDYLGLVPIRLQPAPAPIAAPSTLADDPSYSSPPSSPVSQRSVAPAAAFSVRSSDGHEMDTQRRQHSGFGRHSAGAAHRMGSRGSDSDDDETQSKTVVSLFSSPIASPSREPVDAVMSFDAPLGISARSNPRSMEPSNVLSNFDSDSDDDEHLDDLEGSRQRRRLSSAFRQQDNSQASNMISGGDTVFRVSNSMEDVGYNQPARPLPAASAFVASSKPHVINESPVGVSPAYQRNWSRGTTPVFAMDPTGVFAVPAPRVAPNPAHSVHAPVHSAESGFSSLALSPTVPLSIAPTATQSPAPSISRSGDKLMTPVQARTSPANPFYTAQSTPFRPPTTVSASVLTPSQHSVGAFAQTPLGFTASNIASPTPMFNTAQPPLMSLAQQVQQHQMRQSPSVPFSPRESAQLVDRESAPSPSFAFTPSAALFSAKPRTSSPADPKPSAE